jgi:hypothetical protein
MVALWTSPEAMKRIGRNGQTEMVSHDGVHFLYEKIDNNTMDQTIDSQMRQ